jgi:hypothetical protein
MKKFDSEYNILRGLSADKLIGSIKKYNFSSSTTSGLVGAEINNEGKIILKSLFLK